MFMYALSRRRGGPVSAFGAVLAGVLVFGALLASAAQATPTWHVNGSNFTGSESTSWTGGPTTFKDAFGTRQIDCGVLSGTTSINGGSADTGALTFSSCSVAGAPECIVKPLNINVSGFLGGSTESSYETFTLSAATWIIEGCALKGGYTVSGTFKAQIGEEAVSSSRTLSGSELTVIGSGWSISSKATAKMTGVKAGKRFGTGGAWAPEEPAWWRIAGIKFTGTESISLSKTGAVTIKHKKYGDVISCKSSEGKSLAISGGESSSGQLIFKGCSFPAYPKCAVGKEEIILNTAGYIGRDEWEEKVRERLDVSGTVTFIGICPEATGEGVFPVSGSIAATLTPNGLALKKQFNTKSESITGAPGMKIDGGAWSVTTDIEAVTSGANAGKALSAS